MYPLFFLFFTLENLRDIMNSLEDEIVENKPQKEESVINPRIQLMSIDDKAYF